MLVALKVTIEVASALDRLGINYVVGGSVASSLFGEPRSTNDVDIAIDVDRAALDRALDEFRPRFYVPDEAAFDALRNQGSFNLIGNDSGFKVDLFVHGDGLLDRLQMERRVHLAVSSDPVLMLWVTSPQDQVLRKLDWYRLGGGVSDRQWRDIVGVLRAQMSSLDLAEMRSIARQVDLTELLDVAITAAE